MEQNYGYWRVENGSRVTVSPAEARAAWAESAYGILVGVAGNYHATINYGDLAKEVQDVSGIHTSANQRNWIGLVLAEVVRKADRLGAPPLTALVVRVKDGMVGEGYKDVLEVADEPPLTDELEREKHAAEARFKYYQRFGATLPADGGKAALASRYQQTLTNRRTTAAMTPAPVLCPSCRLQLPATRICDFCGPVSL